MNNSEQKNANTKLGLALARVFFLLLGIVFAQYAFTLYASGSLVFASLVTVSALIALALAVLPNKLFDRILDSLPTDFFW